MCYTLFHEVFFWLWRRFNPLFGSFLSFFNVFLSRCCQCGMGLVYSPCISLAPCQLSSLHTCAWVSTRMTARSWAWESAWCRRARTPLCTIPRWKWQSGAPRPTSTWCLLWQLSQILGRRPPSGSRARSSTPSRFRCPRRCILSWLPLPLLVNCCRTLLGTDWRTRLSLLVFACRKYLSRAG